MFSNLSFLSLGLGLFAVSTVALGSNGRLVPSPTENLFIPIGFDDNDNVEIVVHGHFKNSCYKVGPTDVQIDKQAKTVKVTPQAYEYTGAVCAQMMVPFIQSIKLGMLDAASYKVTVANNQAIPEQMLPVTARHVESPDDFIYAPVEDAKIEVGASTSDQTLVVEGRYPLTIVGCALIRYVKVSTSGDVLVAQPVMDLLTDNNECKARGWTPKFSVAAPLEQPLSKGDKLIHVRVLNGNSYNKVVEIQE